MAFGVFLGSNVRVWKKSVYFVSLRICLSLFLYTLYGVTYWAVYKTLNCLDNTIKVGDPSTIIGLYQTPSGGLTAISAKCNKGRSEKGGWFLQWHSVGVFYLGTQQSQTRTRQQTYNKDPGTKRRRERNILLRKKCFNLGKN